MYLIDQNQHSIVHFPALPAVFDITPLTRMVPVRRGGKASPKHGNILSIIWVVTGTCTCTVDKLSYGLRDNQLICLGLAGEYGLEVCDSAQGFIIHFSATFLEGSEHGVDMQYQDELFRLFSTPVALTLQEDMLEEMKGIVTRMITESENVFLYRSQLLRRYLKIFLIYLSRHNARKEELIINSRSAQLVQKFMVMLEREFKRVKSVNEYASQLAVTPNHLNVIVKKHTRHSAGYHIRQRIVLEAKRLAIYSDTCMKEIAYLLGFSDTAHFSKFFKKSTGINFSEFKRSREMEAA